VPQVEEVFGGMEERPSLQLQEEVPVQPEIQALLLSQAEQ